MTGRSSRRAAPLRCLTAVVLVAAASLLGAGPTRAATEPTTLVDDRCDDTDLTAPPVAIPTRLLAAGRMVPLRDRMGDQTFREDAPNSYMGTPLCAVQLVGGVITYHWLYCNDPKTNSCANGALDLVPNDPDIDPAKAAYALTLADNRTHTSRANSQRLVWCATEGLGNGAVPPTYIENYDDATLRCPDWTTARTTFTLTAPAGSTALVAGTTARIEVVTNRRTASVDAPPGVRVTVCPDRAGTATLDAGVLRFPARGDTNATTLCATGDGTSVLTVRLQDGLVTWRRTVPSGTCQGLMELSTTNGTTRSVTLTWQPGGPPITPPTTTATTGPQTPTGRTPGRVPADVRIDRATTTTTTRPEPPRTTTTTRPPPPRATTTTRAPLPRTTTTTVRPDPSTSTSVAPVPETTSAPTVLETTIVPTTTSPPTTGDAPVTTVAPVPPDPAAVDDPLPILEDDEPRRGPDGVIRFHYVIVLVNRSQRPIDDPHAVLTLPAAVALDDVAHPSPTRGCEARVGDPTTVRCDAEDDQKARLDVGQVIRWSIAVHTTSTKPIEATVVSYDGGKQIVTDREPTTFSALGGATTAAPAQRSPAHLALGLLPLVLLAAASAGVAALWLRGRAPRPTAPPPLGSGAFDAG